MKVMMVCADPMGGHPAYVNEVVAALARRRDTDLSVDLVASVALDKRLRNPAYVIHDVLPAPPQRRGENGLVWRLKLAAALLRSERACLKWLKARGDFDAIHFQIVPWIAAPLFRGYRRMGVPLFATIHNVRPHRYAVSKTVEDAAMRSIWCQCDGLFVHSDVLRDEAATFLGPKHPPIFVVPHGVVRLPYDVPSVPLAERMSWRKALFFGEPRRNKGLHVFLAAMKSLEGYSLTVAGARDLREYWTKTIEPLVQELRRAGRRIDVTLEFVPDDRVASLFKEHSFVVLPYTQDFHAQSGILHLAMALETPVVATSVGGIPEIMARFPIGETAAPDDPAAFAAAVSRLYGRDVAALQRDLKTAAEAPLWDEMAQILSDAYVSIGLSAASKRSRSKTLAGR
jgi:glycosyltransferase involved in cell wall biosynthesis